MTDAEKMKQIRTVIDAGCKVCEHCDFEEYDGSVCEDLWVLDQIRKIVGVDE